MEKMRRRMLIVEDEETLRESLQRLFGKNGFDADVAASAEEAFEAARAGVYDVIITDIILPGIDGVEMISRLREQVPDQVFIVITAYASLETALKALRAGAYDYITKPIIHEEIKRVVENALRQKSLQMENVLLKKQIRGRLPEGIIGESAAIKEITGKIAKIAEARSSVLILGETGTGKELVARAIHFGSSRAERPFVTINCGAIPETLLESELFGHVKGAFTGAVSAKKGLLETAGGGTVFLDEIGDMGLGLQSKLLRVLEDQEIRPVGGTHSLRVDLRFITATNKDIEKAAWEGRFREDLLYRINVITIKVPPLRQRREDIKPLAKHFAERFSGEIGKRVRRITDEALSIFENYDWPGNVRELQNIIERSLLLSGTDELGVECLPDNIRRGGSVLESAVNSGCSIEEYTRQFIIHYQQTHTEQSMANMLGITRKSLWEKRKRWRLLRPE